MSQEDGKPLTSWGPFDGQGPADHTDGRLEGPASILPALEPQGEAGDDVYTQSPRPAGAAVACRSGQDSLDPSRAVMGAGWLRG